jgi:hypothetical protein
VLQQEQQVGDAIRSPLFNEAALQRKRLLVLDHAEAADL